MPRNSSGVYSTPAGTAAVTNTTISSSAYDGFLNDLTTAITQSVNVQGTAPMLAPMNAGGFKIINAAAGVASTDVATVGQISQAVPPGVVVCYPLNSQLSPIPAGYLPCNGALVSTATYANLFAVLGYLWGGSGGSFALPDYRGCVLRGVDQGRGLDMSGTRGTNNFQADYLQNHTHSINDPSHNHSLTQSPHNHTLNDPGHSHGVSDPGHHHAINSFLNSQGGVAAVSTMVSGGNTNTTTSTTGVSVNSTTTGCYNTASNANASINAAFTGISGTQGMNTGNIGTETTVKNYPVTWLIKY